MDALFFRHTRNTRNQPLHIATNFRTCTLCFTADERKSGNVLPFPELIPSDVRQHHHQASTTPPLPRTMGSHHLLSLFPPRNALAEPLNLAECCKFNLQLEFCSGGGQKSISCSLARSAHLFLLARSTDDYRWPIARGWFFAVVFGQHGQNISTLLIVLRWFLHAPYHVAFLR